MKRLVENRNPQGCADLIRQARDYLGVSSEAEELRELSTVRKSAKK
ncbi:MAG: hypothetical protein JRI34_00200 [Deltaproteobacteria bacterium]|nr:hypothetical protein [Deltaproteobacteria bacterium]